jgi:proteasome beta subunit
VVFRLHDSGSSFFDFLSSQHPQNVPTFSRDELAATPSGWSSVPHGTTVLALRFNNGVLIAGDRMATEGYSVSVRKMDKVFKTDEFSAIAIAGAAGPAIEMSRLFQTELEHYEKLEGISLTTEGKANKLAQMIRSNLPMAFQGLVVVPIFVSYDHQKEKGRIFKYDITGGRYEETEFFATGSGGKDARNILKTRYQADLEESEALRIAVDALINAAEEDIGTGGPDPIRGIYPTVKIITRQGTTDVEESKIIAAYNELIGQKRKGAS